MVKVSKFIFQLWLNGLADLFLKCEFISFSIDFNKDNDIFQNFRHKISLFLFLPKISKFFLYLIMFHMVDDWKINVLKKTANCKLIFVWIWMKCTVYEGYEHYNKKFSCLKTCCLYSNCNALKIQFHICD